MSVATPTPLVFDPLLAQGIRSTGTIPTAAAGVEQVPYSSLVEATDNFSSTELSEGGHHIGRGGFGDVYCCSVKMTRGERQVAVKVLHTKVRC